MQSLCPNFSQMRVMLRACAFLWVDLDLEQLVENARLAQISENK